MIAFTSRTHNTLISMCCLEWFILKHQGVHENAQLIGVVTAT